MIPSRYTLPATHRRVRSCPPVMLILTDSFSPNVLPVTTLVVPPAATCHDQVPAPSKYITLTLVVPDGAVHVSAAVVVAKNVLRTGPQSMFANDPELLTGHVNELSPEVVAAMNPCPPAAPLAVVG